MKKLWLNEREYVFFNEAKTRLSDEIATRKRSPDFYSIIQNLPDPDPVLKAHGNDIKIYKGLLSDPHVWACVQSRKSGVLSLQWEVNRGQAKSRESNIIENVFKKLDLNIVISEILNCVLFGFQPLEVMWQNTGSLILPKQIIAKPPEWFVFDDDNNLKFKTKENYMGEVLPDWKFLCPQYEPTYENPYGERTLARIFWSLSLKRGGMKFWLKFTEKYGMPFLIGKHPRGTGKEDTADLANLLEAMVQDAIAVIPDDSSIELQEASKSSSIEVYEKLIDKMNAEISKAILGQTLTTEIGKQGSYAASKTHFDVRKDIIDADKRIVERTLNKLISWIYEINFTGDAGKKVNYEFSDENNMPVFSMWEEEDVDLNLAQRDKILSDAGFKFSKKYLMKAYGFAEEDLEVANKEPDVNKTQTSKSQNSFKEFNCDAGDKSTFFKESEFPDQQAIDDFITSFTSEELQRQAEIIFGSVMELVNNASSYEEVQEKLSIKGLNTNEIENILQKTIFISEIWGLINGKD